MILNFFNFKLKACLRIEWIVAVLNVLFSEITVTHNKMSSYTYYNNSLFIFFWREKFLMELYWKRFDVVGTFLPEIVPTAEKNNLGVKKVKTDFYSAFYWYTGGYHCKNIWIEFLPQTQISLQPDVINLDISNLWQVHSQELTRVNPDWNIFSIKYGTDFYFLYRGLVHHHHRILNLTEFMV